MDAVIRAERLGKRFARRGQDRPSSLKEAILSRRLHVAAQQFWGLRDLSFQLEPGRTLGIVGRNGAGKSTLLRLIGGVIKPDEGNLTVHGRVGGLLDLGAGLTEDLTGRENIILSGVIAGMTRAEVAARFDDIVEFAELEPVVDVPIRTYSSGMRMRLAFAVAAHVEPDILLIDEVLTVGDTAFQRKCLDRMEAFKRRGCTIVLVSHDESQIRDFCDEALLLQQGRLRAFGDAAQVMDEYVALTGGAADGRRSGAARKPRAPAPMRAHGQDGREPAIEAVRLLTRRGRPTARIASGDGLVVEVDYVTADVDLPPHVSVTIQDDSGGDCLDMNTEVAGVDLPLAPAVRTLRFTLDRLDLSGGVYWLSVGLFEPGWARAYDYQARRYRLEVAGAATARGCLYPPARWEVAPERDAAQRAAAAAR